MLLTFFLETVVNMTKCVDKYTCLLFSNNMHSILTRLNNGSAFMSSCVMTLLVAIALTTFLFNPNPQGDLTISSINVFVRFFLMEDSI